VSRLYPNLSTHPFFDVYVVRSDRATPFDSTISQLACINAREEKVDKKKKENSIILYLGYSENDNTPFRKSDVSIAVISDRRLCPKLDCNFQT